MQRTVYVVGTGHHYQFGAGVTFGGYACSTEDARRFEAFLLDASRRYGIATIAEELSREALQEVGGTSSVPENVAKLLSIRHCFCDPDRSERVALGIEEENAIRASGFMENARPEDIEARVLDSIRRRESEWLNRLSRLDSNGTLFVCGSDHVAAVVSLLSDVGYRVTLLHQNWDAQGFV